MAYHVTCRGEAPASELVFILVILLTTPATAGTSTATGRGCYLDGLALSSEEQGGSSLDDVIPMFRELRDVCLVEDGVKLFTAFQRQLFPKSLHVFKETVLEVVQKELTDIREQVSF